MNYAANTKPLKKMSLSSVAKPFLALFIPMAILVGGVITILYFKETANQQTALKLKEISRLNTQKEVINHYIQAIATDVLIMSRHHELRMLLDTGLNRHRQSLAKEFLWFSKIKRIYDQVRFLDERGMEALRVNFNNGNPRIVSNEKLQLKGERYYFNDTFQLSENEVFVSPFDLNIEQGKIELPLKPMIRFGTPVFDGNGKKRGVVLLNYLGSNLLDTLKGVSGNGTGKYFLLNSDGYFLCGPHQDDEWGFMYENKKNRTFERNYPDVWQKISKVESGQFSSAYGIFTFATIRPFTEAQISSSGSSKPYKPSEKLIQGSEYNWKLISHIAPVAVPWRENPLLTRMSLIYAVMLVLLGFGVVLIACASAKRKQAEKEVRSHRDYLKQMVEQRTSELTKANEQLQNDINKRKQVEKALRESEAKYRSMMEAMDDAAYICSEDFRIIYMNSAMLEWIGYDAVGEPCYKVIHGLDAGCPWCVHEKVMQGEHVKTEVISPKDNKTYDVSNSPIFHTDGSISKLTIFRDNSEIKKIENQLLQAQKMESVGRLAGGVAHDYNNALSVIIGFTELAIDEVEPESTMHANLSEVLKAANNAAEITRQLLAFARKQAVVPRVLDLNSNVEHTLKMLRRLIGEDIDLVWLPETNLWPVKIDPSQINQILANLCVNARDAIKGVGKVTIETKNTSFDEAYCNRHVHFIPGEFVLLSVGDNGCGMERNILDNIFEPFFTTKGVDKGTGLGLATVYGIVQQNNGFINVGSEVGKGTTIGVYLPRHEGDIAEIQENSTEEIPTGQGEIVLLVEDDLSILKLTRQFLTRLGYTALTARTPKTALKQSEEYEDKIDLLITDVILPEMNGVELVEKMESFYPNIKHIFMSGYTADVIINSGVQDEGACFIRKPFSLKDLAKMVREVLDKDKGKTQQTNKPPA